MNTNTPIQIPRVPNETEYYLFRVQCTVRQQQLACGYPANEHRPLDDIVKRNIASGIGVEQGKIGGTE